ncbi:hypothetical protein PSTG_17810 [Puccinia striiformis f. sp. tritici PST-78]|uniref:GCM domain-containing protein n=1 Tax=Puccinia striiformis f. sp. tritici PST-78 TaxID=1165861 RepID=A0A0L0UP34_9BASI|nr:hypothetical protein PSTG_17810 [Puccinia striiformis f. sp. tritici PST-78]
MKLPLFKQPSSPGIPDSDMYDVDEVEEEEDADGGQVDDDEEEECPDLQRNEPSIDSPKVITTPNENPTEAKATPRPNTFIDHGTKVDDEGYPLYPNGNTVFVLLPGDKVTNFGLVRYTKRIASNTRSEMIWKVTRPRCLGALVCDNPGCQWAGSPPTGKEGMDKFLSTEQTCPGLAAKCNGIVSHLQCTGTACRIDYNEEAKWGLLRHSGNHMHPWPEAKKPDKLLTGKFKGEVKKNPKAGAFELKLGKPTDPTAPFNSVTSIHPAYWNKDCLAYYRRKMLVEMNLAPDKNGGGVGDKFILDMFGWAACGLMIISSSFMPNQEHFTFQTRWMSDRLFARNHEGKVYDGGLLSDVTY